jgi:integrase
MSGSSYSELKIYGNNLDQEWFVGFSFFCPIRQKEKRVQVRLGINYHTTIKARITEAEKVKDLVLTYLKEGWNPWECPIKEYMKIKRGKILKAQAEEAQKKIGDPRYLTFNDAMDWAYKKKDLKKDTRPGMESVLRFIKQAAIEIGIDAMPIKEVNRFFVCELLDKMRANRQVFYESSENKKYKGKNITPNLYNYYKHTVSALFFEYENRGIIEYNPCHKIAKKEAIDFGVHRHPTEKEISIIKAELPKRHAELYSLLRFEYVSGMRPDEILDVKFEMVNYLNSCIDVSDALYNDEGELISKTPGYRRVAIPHYLLEWIRERSVGHEPTDFLFSWRLRPGDKRITRKWISTLWKIIVIDGLGINVSFYSFKGAGGDAKRKAGIDLDAVAAGYGHTGTNMAKSVYLSGEGERLEKQIIEKAPDL